MLTTLTPPVKSAHLTPQASFVGNTQPVVFGSDDQNVSDSFKPQDTLTSFAQKVPFDVIVGDGDVKNAYYDQEWGNTITQDDVDRLKTKFPFLLNEEGGFSKMTTVGLMIIDGIPNPNQFLKDVYFDFSRHQISDSLENDIKDQLNSLKNDLTTLIKKLGVGLPESIEEHDTDDVDSSKPNWRERDVVKTLPGYSDALSNSDVHELVGAHGYFLDQLTEIALSKNADTDLFMNPTKES